MSDPRFVKSTFSGGNGGDCVEWAHTSAGVYVRDSKDRLGPELGFAAAEWDALTAAVAAGAAHDAVTPASDGVRLAGRGGALTFTHSEWCAFTAAARAGECGRALDPVR